MPEHLEKTGHFYQKATYDKDGNIMIEIVHLMKKPNDDIMELMEITKNSKEFLAWFYPNLDHKDAWATWLEKNNGEIK